MTLRTLAAAMATRIRKKPAGLSDLEIAETGRLQAEESLALHYIADELEVKGSDTYIVYLPRIMEKVGVDEDRLRLILDELIADKLITPCLEHPLDMWSDTEAFVLSLENAPKIPHIESPAAAKVRRQS